ncbi:hypothetical protein JW877_01525 [bacterium]|nr:hypothetical protein [bacterium]
MFKKRWMTILVTLIVGLSFCLFMSCKEEAEEPDEPTLTDKVVVYCYTGHSGAAATMCLKAMGYDASNLRFGIMSWTKDEDVRATSPYTETECIGAATETTIEDYPADNDLPDFDSELLGILDDALNSIDPVTYSAITLYDEINGEERSQILSVRSATHYAIGHIPGAENIPWKEVYDADKLTVLKTLEGGINEVARQAAEDYLTQASVPLTITAADLDSLLNDGDEDNDPFVLSVRSATHYAIGHIPGAYNIPWSDLASDTLELKKLPTDRTIVVYCYTGHTGGYAATVLNLLGYTAKNLKWGIMSWTNNADVRASNPFNEDDWGDYEVNTGDTP